MRLTWLSIWLVFLLDSLSVLANSVNAADPAAAAREQAESFFGGSDPRHTNNWAVLVCSSRYWFNYRHMANTLAMYRTIKRLGIPDSNIILMLADDVACNARNHFPATVYGNADRQIDLYGDNVEVDYIGYDVTVENFLRVLTGRLDPHVPPNKRLLSDASSNVFIYLTGHGGNEFLKFQDNEEVSAFDIADAVEQMWEKRRYNKLLFVIDTCQANSMYSKMYSPNIIATGSSEVGESSLSHHNDMDIGVAVIDGFTHFVLNYLEEINKTSSKTIQELFDAYDPVEILSHPGISTLLSRTPPSELLVTDFLGGVARVEVARSHAGGVKEDGAGWEASYDVIDEIDETDANETSGAETSTDKADSEAKPKFDPGVIRNTEQANPTAPTHTRFRPLAKRDQRDQKRQTRSLGPLEMVIGGGVLVGVASAVLARC